VETRIQKARGAFTRLRKIWLAHYINKVTKIKMLNVYVKSVYYYMGAKPGLLHVKFRKASVLCKQMLAIYHEDLVAQGYM
jgi:hypothetical protein